MLRHISLLKLHPDAPTDKVAQVLEACRRLPEEVDGLRSASAGRALDLGDGALARARGIPAAMADLAIVLDFVDADAWSAYAAGEVRRRLVDDLLGPLVSERRAVQYEL